MFHKTLITAMVLSGAFLALGQAPMLTTDTLVEKAATEAAKRPHSDDAWVTLADALMQKSRETADVAYCNRAEGAYRKALELNSKRVDAMVGLAWTNGVRHEFETSIEWAKKALALDPKSAAAYGLIGDADVEMGNYDRAYEDYQKMLDLRPNLSSYGRSGHLLHITGDTRKASVLMMKAIEAGDPRSENTAWCRSQLALIFYSEGAYPAAEQVLQIGIKNVPNDYRLLATMGKVKAAEKQYESAVEYYRKAIAIAPQEDTVAALGDIYAATGKPTEAEKQYAMVETIAKLYKANGVKGDMLTAKFYADHDRKLKQALELAEEEYRTRKNVYAADTLAWCYFKNGRVQEAKKYIDIALSHNTPEAVFHFHKGMIYAKADDRATAQLELYEAMSINPNFDVLQTPIAMKMNEELGSQTPKVQTAMSAR